MPKLKKRPCECFLCQEPLHYVDDSKHEPEFVLDVSSRDGSGALQYVHQRCWQTLPTLKAEVTRLRALVLELYSEACPGWATTGCPEQMLDAMKRRRKGLEAAVRAAQALLDPEGTLEAAGVHPGPEREELERALRALQGSSLAPRR